MNINEAAGFTFKWHLITAIILGLITLALLGWFPALIVFCFPIGFYISNLKEATPEQIAKYQEINRKNSKTKTSSTSRTANFKVNLKESDDDRFFNKNREREKRYRNASIIDEIQFEYVTAEGILGTYTVQAYKGLRGNIEGFCVEREDIRTFVPDRIVNSTVVRTETGEILTLKEWRAMFRAG